MTSHKETWSRHTWLRSALDLRSIMKSWSLEEKEAYRTTTSFRLLSIIVAIEVFSQLPLLTFLHETFCIDVYWLIMDWYDHVPIEILVFALCIKPRCLESALPPDQVRKVNLAFLMTTMPVFKRGGLVTAAFVQQLSETIHLQPSEHAHNKQAACLLLYGLYKCVFVFGVHGQTGILNNDLANVVWRRESHQCCAWNVPLAARCWLSNFFASAKDTSLGARLRTEK